MIRKVGVESRASTVDFFKNRENGRWEGARGEGKRARPNYEQSNLLKGKSFPREIPMCLLIRFFLSVPGFCNYQNCSGKFRNSLSRRFSVFYRSKRAHVFARPFSRISFSFRLCESRVGELVYGNDCAAVQSLYLLQTNVFISDSSL